VLPVGWLVVAVVVAVLLTMWVTFTLTRLDRLHARVDAAHASMDAQLVRRAAALLHAAESPDSGVPDHLRTPYDEVAARALNTSDANGERQDVENAVGRAVADLAALPQPLHQDLADELNEAAARVLIARRFYNDAVRDTRALRARRMPRLFRMAGRREFPQFFDIDDTLPISTPPARPPTPIPPPMAARPADRTSNVSPPTMEEDRS
jgi:hypothetical protein